VQWNRLIEAHTSVLPLTRIACTAYDATELTHAGRSAAWLARLPWEQEVTGSNPVAPTIFRNEPFGKNVEPVLVLNSGISVVHSEFKSNRATKGSFLSSS
jgi:hypothetical protein